MPVPRGVLEILVRELAGDLVTVFRGSGILVVDLREWLPAELDLTVLTVQAMAAGLHLWLGPGSLRDVPGDPRPALTADLEETSEPR